MLAISENTTFNPSFKSFGPIEIEYYINTFNELYVDASAVHPSDSADMVKAVNFINGLNPAGVSLEISDSNDYKFNFDFDLIPSSWTQF